MSAERGVPAHLREIHEREREFHDRLAASVEDPAAPASPPDEWEQAMLDGLGEVAGQRVLDLGCGDGNLSLHLLARGASVTGIDLSPGMVELARRRAERHHPEARSRFLVGAAEATGLEDASFDAIAGKWVLHHVDLGIALPELRRILVPGGRGYFLDTSARNPLLPLLRRHLVGRRGVTRYGTEDEHPLTPADARRIIDGFGGPGRVEYPVMFLARLLDRHVTHTRHGGLARTLARLDSWAVRRRALAPLSYYVAIRVSTPQRSP